MKKTHLLLVLAFLLSQITLNAQSNSLQNEIQTKVKAIEQKVIDWRRDIHQNPEILFETHRTSALVAEKLREFGCDEVYW